MIDFKSGDRRLFEIQVRDCAWRIATRDPERPDWMWQSASTNAETGPVIQHVTTYPNKMMRAVTSPYLVPVHGDDATHGYLFLMFASHCLLQSNGPVTIPAFFHVVVRGDFAKPFELPATRDLMNADGGDIRVPSLVQLWNDGKRYSRDAATHGIVAQPLKPPYDKGYLAFEARAGHLKSFNGILWPEGFEAREFVPSPPNRSFNDLRVTRVVTATVTNVVRSESDFAGVPKLKPGAQFSDLRFDPDTNRGFLTVRVEGDRWPSYQSGVELKQQRARETGGSKKLKSILIIGLAFAAVMPIGFYLLHRWRTSRGPKTGKR